MLIGIRREDRAAQQRRFRAVGVRARRQRSRGKADAKGARQYSQDRLLLPLWVEAVECTSVDGDAGTARWCAARAEVPASCARYSGEMPSHESHATDTFTLSSALSAIERDRLAGLLAAMSPPRRWAVEHMHSPLLCVLGLVKPPDAAYAHAAERYLVDAANTRRRALTLVDQLERYARSERREHHSGKRGHGFPFASHSAEPGEGDR